MAVSLESLTSRDIEVATLLATGYTRASVARKLNCSEPTIQGVITRLRNATGGENVTHMVAILLDEEVIQISNRNRDIPEPTEYAGEVARAVYGTLRMHAAQMSWDEFLLARRMYNSLLSKGL